MTATKKRCKFKPLQLGPAHDKFERKVMMVHEWSWGKTLEEIASSYGVSRARAGQLLQPYEFTERRSTWRVYVPNSLPRNSERSDFSWHRFHAGRERRRQRVQELRALVQELGRAPTIGELSKAFGISHNATYITLSIIWLGRTRGPRRKAWYQNGMRRWFRLAGVELRPLGFAGRLPDNG